MPRILRILNRLNIGGPTYNAVFLTHYLAPEFETRLVAGLKDDAEGDSSYIAHRLGIEPVYLGHMQRELHPARDWRALQQLRALIREFRPDIVHTHAAKAGALGRTAAALEGVPIRVHTFHGHVFHSYFSPLKTRVFLEIERRLAALSQAIVAVSPSQKDELVSTYRVAGADKVRVIPNGFELGRFDPSPQLRADFRSQFRLADDEFAIGIVGRLTAVKNHALFLNALARLRELTAQPIRACIIGDGEDRPALEQLARELGLRTRAETGPAGVAIEWTSWIHDIEQAYAGLDLVALSSHNEGTPVSLIEAQAAGLPVVSTRVGGVADVVVDGDSGWLTPPGDVEAFAQALHAAVTQPHVCKRYGEAGSEHARARYGVERLAADMRRLYLELLAQAPRR